MTDRSAQTAPAVSVVLPAYNRADTIRPSIESVLRQTWADFELLVVDDCSTDATRAAVEAIDDPRLKLLSTPQNMGPSGARNIGIEAARAPWIAFQDSDDEWLPEKLERQMARTTETGAGWVAVYCGMAIVGDPGTGGGRTKVMYIPRPRETEVEGDIAATLHRTNLVSTQMLLTRADVLREIGGFDTGLSALVDWDLVLRLIEHGPFAFVDEPLVIQRFSENSITRDSRKRAFARARILEKFHDRMAGQPRVLAQHYRTLASEMVRQKSFERAHGAIRKGRGQTPWDPGLFLREGYIRLRQIAARLTR